jgi:hypothetical protein
MGTGNREWATGNRQQWERMEIKSARNDGFFTFARDPILSTSLLPDLIVERYA